VRHDHLHYELRVGRKSLETYFKELMTAGYMQRDAKQSRDKFNRFTTLNYIVRNVPLRRNYAATTRALNYAKFPKLFLSSRRGET
jgi:hypothetical protein